MTRSSQQRRQAAYNEVMGPRLVRLSMATLVALMAAGATGGGQIQTTSQQPSQQQTVSPQQPPTQPQQQQPPTPQPPPKPPQPPTQPQQQQPPPQQPPPTQQPTQPPQQQPVFRAGVKLVRVDVSVTGKGDLPVADLTADDFEVSEDGVPQKVEQLQFVRLNGQRPPGDESSLEIRSQDQAEAEAAREDVRVFAIFFDDYHVDKEPQIMIPLKRGLSEFVKALWPTDLMCLMDPLTTLSALKFTRSKSDILDDIRQLQGRQGEIFPIKSVIEEAQLQSGEVDRIRAQVTFSALEALVVKLGGLREGRKTVVFVSQGPRTFFPSRGISLQTDLNDVLRAANQGNVGIYAIDPRGLGLDNRAGDRNTLMQLAAETGGRAVYNTNNFEPGLEKSLVDTSAYYVLGYTPTRTEDDGKFHKIAVKLKRPGMKVLGRLGYWAPSAKDLAAVAAAASKVVEPNLAATLKSLSVTEASKRLVEVWTGTSRNADGKTELAVSWESSDAVEAATVAGLKVEVLAESGGKPIQPAQDMPAMLAGKALKTKAVFVLDPKPVVLSFELRSLDGTIIDHWTQPQPVPDLLRARPRTFDRRVLPGSFVLRVPRASDREGPGPIGAPPVQPFRSRAGCRRVLCHQRRGTADRRSQPADDRGTRVDGAALAAARERQDAIRASRRQPWRRRLRAEDSWTRRLDDDRAADCDPRGTLSRPRHRSRVSRRPAPIRRRPATRVPSQRFGDRQPGARRPDPRGAATETIGNMLGRSSAGRDAPPAICRRASDPGHQPRP